MDTSYVINNMIASSIAEIITLPLCTIKTNHQVNNNKYLKETVLQIYNKHKFIGFYQASFSSVLSQVLSTTTKYSFYKYLSNIRQTNKNDILQNSINGIIGGLIGSIICHPVDVYKNYTQRGVNYFEELRIKKFKILYQGYSQTIIKNILLYSILYPTYDYYYLKTNNNFISSIGTTITVGIITQPIDYLKTRYIAGIYNFNIRDLYKGFSIMLMRNIPNFLITMSIINYLNNKN
jgi:hypothetical protein